MLNPHTLYLLSYNSYYNRQIKIEDNLQDYAQYLAVLAPISNINFNPNDEVNTQQVINMSDSATPDYLLVVDTATNTLLSRWFIIDKTRTVSGQWNLTLRRDLLADYYNDILNADTFIEKATLAYDDPLVFNSENMGVNQIKTREELLTDKTGCSWIVGYYPSNINIGTIVADALPSDEPTSIKKIGVPIEDWTYYNNCIIKAENKTTATPFYGEIQSCNYQIYSKWKGSDLYINSTNYRSGETSTEYKRFQGPNSNTSLTLEVPISPENLNLILQQSYNDVGLQYMESLLQYGVIQYSLAPEIQRFLDFSNYTIQDEFGKRYTVSVTTTTLEQSKDVTVGSALYNQLKSVIDTMNSDYIVEGADFFSGTPNNDSFKVKAKVTGYTFELTPAEEEKQIKVTFNENVPVAEQAPWKIFAIPFGRVRVRDRNGITIVTTNADLGLKMANAIERNLSDPSLYDLQLLPYCPITPNEDGSITVQDWEYQSIKTGPEGQETILGVVLNITKPQFHRVVYYTIPQHNTAIEKKFYNECYKWRLTAPNYSNYFDFSAEKNNGVIYFDVDCDYKPYTPYIHINPDFKGLYGYDDNSPRGLVCGGDYSLSQSNTAWQTYQAQNKNFQLTFDRQIQNMEINNSIARKQEGWQVAAGTIQGGVSGAYGAGMASGGNPYAMIAGGAAGGVLSLGGGLLDLKYNEQLRNEAMDYTKDMFGYNLGNIQAAPNTISKVSALNENNKIFPILEFYTCTDREKKAFLNKVAWNGMTVMAIGKIGDYIGNTWSYDGITSKGYVKGQLIRLYIDEDFHIINEIAKEINLGFYTEA